MSSYGSNFTVRFKNKGVGSLYWEASLEPVGAPAWPEGASAGILGYDGELRGPVEFGEIVELTVRATAIDGMKKATSPYNALLQIWGYADRNKQVLTNLVGQTGKLYILTGGILSLVGTLDFLVYKDQVAPVTIQAALSNVGDIDIQDWDTILTVSSGLSGKITRTPSSGGPLGLVGFETLDVTIPDPSAVDIGTYTGILIAQDLSGWADAVSIPVAVEVRAAVTMDLDKADLTWIPGDSNVQVVTLTNNGNPATTLSWKATSSDTKYVRMNKAGVGTPDSEITGTLLGGQSQAIHVYVDYDDFAGTDRLAVGSSFLKNITFSTYAAPHIANVVLPITLNTECPAGLHLVYSNCGGRVPEDVAFNLWTGTNPNYQTPIWFGSVPFPTRWGRDAFGAPYRLYYGPETIYAYGVGTYLNYIPGVGVDPTSYMVATEI